CSVRSLGREGHVVACRQLAPIIRHADAEIIPAVSSKARGRSFNPALLSASLPITAIILLRVSLVVLIGVTLVVLIGVTPIALIGITLISLLRITLAAAPDFLHRASSR